MKLVLFMSEDPISNNKEKINIVPFPPGTPLAKIISLNNTEILILMLESPVSNNKENINLPPPLRHFVDTALKNLGRVLNREVQCNEVK